MNQNTADDFSHGLAEQAQLIQWHVGVWHDLGYPEPLPSPGCHPIPPLGRRNAAAIKGGHDAIEDIDELIRQLHRLREQLVSELRQDQDARAAAIVAEAIRTGTPVIVIEDEDEASGAQAYKLHAPGCQSPDCRAAEAAAFARHVAKEG